MKYVIVMLMLSLGYSQVTLTQEQADNIAKNIQELQIKSDSLTVSDSLKITQICILRNSDMH